MQELNIGDAFKKGGPFVDNIRISIDGDDDELRESMKAHGWVEEFPALSDEHEVILVGHRRLKIAKELGIAPVIQKLVIGDGDEADAKRLRLAIVSNVGHKPMTKEDRQRIAKYLYGEREWSEQRIADALGVTQKTISKDLEGIYTEGINQKPAKTKTNPKGAGRPKGTKKKPRKAPKPHDRTDEFVSLSKQGLSDDEISSETGVSKHTIRREIERENIRQTTKAEAPEIDLATLSMSAQQKLDAVVRREKERLYREFEAMKYQWLKEKTDSFLERLQPQLRAEQETAKRIMMRRDGFMTKKIYRLIISCLHPDWVTDPTQKERYAAAFSEFTKLEKFLLSEKDSPTVFADIPRTRAEWDERKRKVSEERKARRAASKSGIQPK